MKLITISVRWERGGMPRVRIGKDTSFARLIIGDDNQRKAKVVVRSFSWWLVNAGEPL